RWGLAAFARGARGGLFFGWPLFISTPQKGRFQPYINFFRPGDNAEINSPQKPPQKYIIILP
ncbi:MAG: hypothetical protein Q8Q97_00140, partial [bacterium]|nr:hypothetical protein [bacterium]